MIRRILLGTDFKPESQTAELWARDLAEKYGATVVLLHAIEPLATVGGEEPDREFYETLERAAQSKLREMSDRFTSSEVDVKAVVTIGRRWREVVRIAELEKADLIVVGARSRVGPNGQPLLGTTSHNVYLASPVPVLVVRSKD